MQIYNFDEFIKERYSLLNHDDFEMVNEGFLFKRRTGNLVSKMLGGTERTGTAIFENINRNVALLEKAIEEYNAKHKTSIGKKNILELHIDKAKLDLKHLIVMATLTSAGFIADVIVGNILNYRMLIRPIRNAKIMALAYKYYLSMIRHTLQISLITLNMSSDLFFAQIAASMSGHKKAMKDFATRLRTQITRETIDMWSGQTMTDDKGNTFSLNSILTDKQMKRISSWMKTYKTTMDHEMNYNSKMGYNQNIYQESGRNIESLVKSCQDKELQALSEQFNTISQTSSQEAKEMVANYAQSVKHSVEARAMQVCIKINMNMLDILEMFSIRKIDGYTDAFEEMGEYDNKKDDDEKEIEKLKNLLENMKHDCDTQLRAKDEEYQSKLNDEEKRLVLEKWKEKGIDRLCPESGANSFRNIAYGNADVRKILADNKFSNMQIEDIVMGTGKVSDYEKLYTDVAKMYAKKTTDSSAHSFGIDFGDKSKIKIEPEDSSTLYKWYKVNSVEGKHLTAFIANIDKELSSKKKTSGSQNDKGDDKDKFKE